MKRSIWILAVVVAVLLVLPAGVSAKKITVNWWHAHGGQLG